MIYKLSIKTRSKVEFQDITHEVQKTVQSGGTLNGICYVYVPHTTAAVTINEHADPRVVDDIAAQLDEIAPQNKHYRHMEGNSPAHIKASLMGDSRILFIEDGKLVLGTWQGIFFGEFDGPRIRSVLVKIAVDKT